MNRNGIIAIVVVVVIVLVGGVLLFNRKATQPVQPSPTRVVAHTSQLAATSPTSEGGTTQATANTVTLTGSGFNPKTITIQAGETVVWKNESGQEATVNSDPHPIHTDYPPLNLGQFKNGGSLQLSFPKQGRYGYHNHLNPSQTGTVVVQ